METIIFAVIIGLGLAYFAVQNTQTVALHVGSFAYKGIPLYLIVIGALLGGLLLAWIFSLLQLLSTYLSLQRKDNKLREAQRTISELTKRVHFLEIEAARSQKRKKNDGYDEKA